MNRICVVFDDIGNINMNWAGIAPFNYQMLLKEPCLHERSDVAKEFCNLSNLKKTIMIQTAEENPNSRENNKGAIIQEHIETTLIKKFGSLENCYPHVVKYLFTGENAAKASNKQTFWKIFGSIALSILKENLENCTVCSKCGAKIPNWAKNHVCPKEDRGFFECVTCGEICRRVGSKQIRCHACQEEFRREYKTESARKHREQRKEVIEKRTTYLQSQQKKT